MCVCVCVCVCVRVCVCVCLSVHPLTVLHVRPWFQNDDPSSKLKSTPPMGAPKAAATPAAAPLDTKSRLSLQKEIKDHFTIISLNCYESKLLKLAHVKHNFLSM